MHMLDNDVAEIRKLEKAAAFLGVDFWDPKQIEEICGSPVTEFELQRMRALTQ